MNYSHEISTRPYHFIPPNTPFSTLLVHVASSVSDRIPHSCKIESNYSFSHYFQFMFLGSRRDKNDSDLNGKKYPPPQKKLFPLTSVMNSILFL
jgi:hypothetical protein